MDPIWRNYTWEAAYANTKYQINPHIQGKVCLIRPTSTVREKKKIMYLNTCSFFRSEGEAIHFKIKLIENNCYNFC